MSETPSDASTRHRPAQPDDDLDQLGERIAVLSAQISAATYQLLLMIRDFDERGGWNCGFRSCAHWLSWRVGLALGAAREKVRVARALADLPLISEALRTGELSYSKARALTRVARADNEESLLGFARAGTAAHVERLVRGIRKVNRIEANELAERQRASRFFSAYTDDDGMLVLRARLEPEVGAVLMQALRAAADRLYVEGRKEKEPLQERVGQSARLADAVGVVAESALAQGLDPGTRGDRYQVVVHVEKAVLDGEGDRDSECRLEDGADVSAETLACATEQSRLDCHARRRCGLLAGPASRGDEIPTTDRARGGRLQTLRGGDAGFASPCMVTNSEAHGSGAETGRRACSPRTGPAIVCSWASGRAHAEGFGSAGSWSSGSSARSWRSGGKVLSLLSNRRPWAVDRGVELHFYRPGKPTDAPFIESPIDD